MLVAAATETCSGKLPEANFEAIAFIETALERPIPLLLANGFPESPDVRDDSDEIEFEELEEGIDPLDEGVVKPLPVLEGNPPG